MTAINRILIVDDEDNVRRMLSTAFALQGFETHCANNGRTALHLFADIHPDVVLMDIRMPEMDGIKALKEMRSHETRTPVILMTAYVKWKPPSKHYAAEPSTMLSNRLISMS